MCWLCQSLSSSLLTAYLRDQFRPTVEDRQDLLFFGRGQAHRHAGNTKIAVMRQYGQILRRAAQVTDSGLRAVAAITVGCVPMEIHDLLAGDRINLLVNAARIREVDASRALVPQNIRVATAAVEPVRERHIVRL